MRQVTAKKEETAVLDIILSNLAEGVVVTDGQWKIKNMNQTAQEILDIHETETTNMDLLAHLSHMNLSIPVETVANTWEKITDFQILPLDNQHPLYSSARMTKLFDEHGNITGITLILRWIK